MGGTNNKHFYKGAIDMRLIRTQTGNEYRNRPDKQIGTGANLDRVMQKARRSVVIGLLLASFALSGYIKYQALNHQVTYKQQIQIYWQQIKSNHIGSFNPAEMPDGKE